MAPATKRKNEDETPETERKDIYTPRGKNKPIVISSTQFERSFKLLGKKLKEDRTTNITPRLDAATAYSQTNASEAPHVTDEEMEGDWQQPNKTQKPKHDNNLNKTIELTNKYEPLNNQNQEEPENQTQETQPRNTRTVYKPPPITVYNSTIKIMINLINTHQLKEENIKLRQISGIDNTLSIQTSTIDSYNKIIEALKIEQKEFYTYTPKNMKIKSMVLKGVMGDFSEEDVLNELKNKKFNNVTITKVTKIKFNRDNKAQHHFLVQISHDSHLSELTKTKNILYQAVRWEHLKKKQIFQCKNCQRLGHASSNCHLKYRCVKCSLSHEPGKCNITGQIDTQQLKCANCGEEGHPASYRGCPYIKNATKLVNQAKKTKLATTNNRIINMQRKVNPGISYSAITSGSGSFKNTPTYPTQPSHTDHGNSHTATTPDDRNEPIQQQKMNTQPPWVDMIKQELLNVVNRLANIEKQLHDDNNRINNLFEILQCQLVAA